MNILVFSPSTRMVWTDAKRALNPAYQLIAYLTATLSKYQEYTVYSVTQSFKPVMNMKPYKGQKIDMVISLGALYVLSDTTKKIKLDPNFPRHKRMIDAGEIVREVFDKWNPMHINLCVDVNKWSDELTEIYGKAPTYYITEQQEGWTTFLYHYCNRLYQSANMTKPTDFFYAGSAKNRGDSFLRLTENLDMQKVIAGSGWDRVAGRRGGYVLRGFQKFYPYVVTQMLNAKYTVVFQTAQGNEEGWLTGRLFMGMGTRTVGFIDREYDKYCLTVRKNSILRVSDADDITGRIKRYGYKRLLAEQEKMIVPQWENFYDFYVNPFKRRIRKFANQISS